MRGSAIQLREMLKTNDEVFDYIYCNWNVLFSKLWFDDDFMNLTKEKMEWLDEVSAFAIQDLFTEGVA